MITPWLLLIRHHCISVPRGVPPVNSCVHKTVRHVTSLHRICLKLLIDSSPSQLESIDSSPSWLESQTSVHRPTAKLFVSSPIRLESQVSVRRPTLKLIGLSHNRLESSVSVRRLLLKLFGSIPRRLSFDWRRTCWLTYRPSVPRPSQPLTTHVLDVCYPPVTETKISPIVCTPQNYNRNYVLIKLLTTYFITQWRLTILLVLSPPRPMEDMTEAPLLRVIRGESIRRGKMTAVWLEEMKRRRRTEIERPSSRGGGGGYFPYHLSGVLHGLRNPGIWDRRVHSFYNLQIFPSISSPPTLPLHTSIWWTLTWG